MSPSESRIVQDSSLSILLEFGKFVIKLSFSDAGFRQTKQSSVTERKLMLRISYKTAH